MTKATQLSPSTSDVDFITETKYSVAEAARLIGIGRVGVYKAIHEGRLGAYRPGGNKVVIGAHHLQEFLAASNREPKTKKARRSAA